MMFYLGPFVSALSKKFPASNFPFNLSSCIYGAKLLNVFVESNQKLSHSNEECGHVLNMSAKDSVIAEGSDETFAIGISFGNSTSSIAHTSGVSYKSCSIMMI